MTPPLSAAAASKPAARTPNAMRYNELVLAGLCTRCRAPLSLADRHKYARCSSCRGARYRSRYERLVSAHMCVSCAKPMPKGDDRKRCPPCTENKVRSQREMRRLEVAAEQAEPENAATEVLGASARILADIAAGKRCARCWLVTPCGGHETLSVSWHALRRHGEAGG